MNAADRLAQIQARADAATDGTWEARSLGQQMTMPNVRTRRDAGLDEGIAYNVVRGRDAEFIAAARQDVPALAAAIRAVLDLHQSIRFEGSHGARLICNHCSDGGLIDAPCPTVQAIETALGDAL